MNRNSIIGIVSVNILFWIAVYFLGLGFGFTWETPPFSTVDGTYTLTFWWGTIFNMLIFYGNAFWLYPKKRGRKWRVAYWVSVTLFLVFFSLIEACGDFLIASKIGLMTSDFMEYEGVSYPAWAFIWGFSIRLFFVHFFFFLISFINIFYIQSEKSEKTRQLLEREQLKSELKFLKAQINPHFLFNGINSVYHLIDQKPDIAKDTLLKFSNLLRYQLYECNDELIPLEKELDHIRDYVEMEKIRKGGDVAIQLNLPEDTLKVKIPPLLFTPFIENAFKYVSNYDEGVKNNISINIRLQGEQSKLHFELENTVDENKLSNKGGIGIANVKKRLALLFPNQHDLDIIKGHDRFVVRMSLNLIK